MFLLAGCSTEVEVNAPGDPVPVVYCLLNPTVPDQYVRVGRSFQFTSQSDLSFLPNDSTLWSIPVQVYIEQWLNNEPVKTYLFNPDDQLVRDSGLFPAASLKVFTASFFPQPEHEYRLYVYFPDTRIMVSATTRVASFPEIVDPLPVPGRTITFDPGFNYLARFVPPPGGQAFQAEFTFRISEEVDNLVTSRIIRYSTPVWYDFGSTILISKAFNSQRFYDIIVSELDSVPGMIRRVSGLDFSLYTGGTELALATAGDLGTASLVQGVFGYTNLNHGIGVFSSLNTVVVRNLSLSNLTEDMLAYSELTRHLGFLDHYGNRSGGK